MSNAVLKWRGDLVTQRIQAAERQGIRLAAEHLLSESRKQVPVDEGILRASGAVTILGERAAAVSYDTPYARRQHEELGYRHPKGGKAKYLEDPGVAKQQRCGRFSKPR